MKKSFSTQDSMFFLNYFGNLIEPLIKYYVYSGYHTDEIFRKCVNILTSYIDGEEISLANNYKDKDVFIKYEADQLVSYPYTEDLKFKKGEVIGIDKDGHLLLKSEPGWIPRHPFIRQDTNLYYETWTVLTNLNS